jgi:hypothetical protein
MIYLIKGFHDFQKIKMNNLSTQNLELLSTPSAFQKLCKSISALEAIICPDWEYRYFSYQKDWSPYEEFCEMRMDKEITC